MIRKLIILFILLLIIIIATVPNQKAYFDRVAHDYGSIHNNSSITSEMIKEMGHFKYQNWFLYSEFEYQFGNISVSYFGFLNIIIFKNSKTVASKKPTFTV
ncbi:hypothetical protein [Marivirga arenosa]|uniref:DUF4359 domain-containing protein n=1 Tax=Marivirga arenosa TaxID=3059076 RepID=A0AA51X3L4_9BACT|nr:hypothetical protein [Marivirga sp. BKB1-2]WNB16808.1 hypothetical protein QYS47_31835 [Marivirga sp. BKB1-2]